MSPSSVENRSRELTHISDDPHMIRLKCPFCAKQFSGNRSHSGVCSNYRRHLLIHTNQRPYKCCYCGAGFTTKHNMRRHVRALHPLMADSSRDSGTIPITNTSDFHTLQSGKRLDIPILHNPEDISEVNGKDSFRLRQRALPPFTASYTVSPGSIGSHVVQPVISNFSPQHFSLQESQAKMESCHYCGRCFCWSVIRKLHEGKCSYRKGLLTSKAFSEVENASLPNHPPLTVDLTLTVGAVAQCARVNKVTLSKDLLYDPTPEIKAKHLFVCEDCELEVSSSSKLRRHRRFHCPFRDDPHADFLTEVLAVSASARTGAAVGKLGTDGTAGHAYLYQPVEAGGLKFFKSESAFASSNESGTHGRERDINSVLGRPLENNMAQEEHENEFLSAHGSSAETGSSISPESIFNEQRLVEKPEGKTGIECESEDGRTLRDPLHLDFKRRRGGNKRARRILLKRIRAQQTHPRVEVRSLTETTSVLNNLTDGLLNEMIKEGTHTKTDVFHPTHYFSNSDSNTEMPFTSRPSTELSTDKNLTVSSPRGLLIYDREGVPEDERSNVLGIEWSRGLKSRAQALAQSLSKTSTVYSYVCPFDGCMGRFSKQRYWFAHVARSHPREWTQYQERLEAERGREISR